MPEVNEAIVMPLLGKITELNDRYSTASDSYLYSGMSVLARDMYSYLSLHPQSNAKFFLDMIPSVIEEEKKERYDAGFWHDNKLALSL